MSEWIAVVSPRAHAIAVHVVHALFATGTNWRPFPFSHLGCFSRRRETNGETVHVTVSVVPMCLLTVAGRAHRTVPLQPQVYCTTHSTSSLFLLTPRITPYTHNTTVQPTVLHAFFALFFLDSLDQMSHPVCWGGVVAQPRSPMMLTPQACEYEAISPRSSGERVISTQHRHASQTCIRPHAKAFGLRLFIAQRLHRVQKACPACACCVHSSRFHLVCDLTRLSSALLQSLGRLWRPLPMMLLSCLEHSSLPSESWTRKIQ